MNIVLFQVIVCWLDHDVFFVIKLSLDVPRGNRTGKFGIGFYVSWSSLKIWQPKKKICLCDAFNDYYVKTQEYS